MDQINDLKKERNGLLSKIRDWTSRGKNAYEFVVRFNEITEELKRLGRNVSIQTDCLMLCNWEKGGKYYSLRNQQNKSVSSTKQVANQIINHDLLAIEASERFKNQNNYKLQLHYTTPQDKSSPKIISEVNNYFSHMGLNYLNEDIFFNESNIEHTINYEYKGIDEEFNILKKSSQYIIDTFSNDKFNVAVSGKKLKK